MLSNVIFNIHVHNHANKRKIYEKTLGQVPLGPLFGKQNIQAKQVYCSCDIVFVFFSVLLTVQYCLFQFSVTHQLD